MRFKNPIRATISKQYNHFDLLPLLGAILLAHSFLAQIHLFTHIFTTLNASAPLAPFLPCSFFRWGASSF